MGQIGRKDFPWSMTNVGKIHFDRESDTKSGGHFCIFEKKRSRRLSSFPLEEEGPSPKLYLENLITF